MLPPDAHEQEVHGDRITGSDTFARRFRGLVIPFGMLALLIAGLWWSQHAVRCADARLREGLMAEAAVIARMLDRDWVDALSFTAEDLDRPPYRRLREQLLAYAPTVPKMRWVYTMAWREDRIVFGPDSVAASDPAFTPPGDHYPDPPPELMQVFRDGRKHAAGPYQDQWGHFVSAFAPMYDGRTGELVLVVGADMDVTVWWWDLWRARTPALLCTAALLTLLLAGHVVLRRYPDIAARRHWCVRRLEAILCGTTGLVLTLAVAWVLRAAESQARRDAFAMLARAQATGVANGLRDLRLHLDGLGGLFESSDDVALDEFLTYTRPLAKDSLSPVWAWAPRVTAATADGTIWERDAQENRVPVAERGHYFPLTYVSPMTGNTDILGFDLGSETARREALDLAVEAGMVAATQPIDLLPHAGGPRGMLVMRPVYPPGPHAAGTVPSKPLGVVLAVLHFDTLLKHSLFRSDTSEAGVLTDLILLQPGQPPRIVASSVASNDSGAHPPPNRTFLTPEKDLAVWVPIFRFGKTYVLRVRPGPDWLAEHPLNQTWQAGLIGLMLTLLVTLLVGFFADRQSNLQREVLARTQELREREAFARAVLDAVGANVAVVDRRGIITAVNSAWWHFARANGGGGAEEAPGPGDDYLAPLRAAQGADADVARTALAGIEDVLAGRRAAFSLEYPCHSPTEQRWFWMHATPLNGADGGAVLAHVNATALHEAEAERSLLQGQLIQAQKLESIGTLAGGVAHEINNPINGIMNYAQLIEDGLEPDRPERAYATEIIRESERVAGIVRDLLAFARQERHAHSPARPIDIVTGVLSLIRTLLKSDRIALEVDVSERLPHVSCRTHQVQQVLMNLMTNARDTLNQRFAGHAPDKRIRLEAHVIAGRNGRRLRITVTDRGEGIPPENLARVFDPFFTTKPKERGTGLGLSVSHGIAKAHNGDLWVESTVGQGTSMHLDLPLNDKQEATDA